MLFGIGFGMLGVFPTSSGLLKVSLQSVHGHVWMTNEFGDVMVSGKSTTIHFMAASQMILDQRIGNLKPVNVTNPWLKQDMFRLRY